MHKHHGDHGRSKKFFVYANFDDDRDGPLSKGGRGKHRRVRHKPYERNSRFNRGDWLEDFDNDF